MINTIRITIIILFFVIIAFISIMFYNTDNTYLIHYFGEKGNDVTSKTPEVLERDKKIISDYILHKNKKSFPQLAQLIVTTIFKMEEKHNISHQYLLALIQIESTFNVNAVSSKDCIGLSQINYKIWIEDKNNKHNLIKNNVLKTKNQLYYPVKNIEAGAFILKHYISKGQNKNKINPIKYGIKAYHGSGKKASKHYTKFENALGEFLIFKKIKESQHELIEKSETHIEKIDMIF